MVGGGQPGFAPLLYKELIKRPEYTSPEQRQGLMRRIRETLFKLIVIIGVCKPLEAIFDIDAITQPEDKDYTFSRCELLCRSSRLVAKVKTEMAGNVMKPTQSAGLHGKTACTNMTNKISTTCWLHSGILVLLQFQFLFLPNSIHRLDEQTNHLWPVPVRSQYSERC
jgi:hypothetical protein